MPTVLLAGQRVDRYRVLGPIGSGGMASIYRVQHEVLGTEHVLKVLSVRGKRLEQRLLREGDIQGRLKHRNVVEVTDVLELEGEPVLAMEFVRGPSLEDVLSEGPLRVEHVERLASGILAGVAAAHRAGVVHRDLKPANILLSVTHGKVVPKVADFGLVKMADPDPDNSMTRTGSTMGTPQYMAPEQIQDAKNVDQRADVFALGAIFYEMLCGEQVFQARTHYRVYQKVIDGEYTPLREKCPVVPERMESAIDSALAPLEQRPDSLEAFWASWSGSEVALETAAAADQPWEKNFLDRLERCSPVLGDPLRVSTMATTATVETMATMVDPVVVAQPRRALLVVGLIGVLMAAAVLVGIVLALGTLLILP